MSKLATFVFLLASPRRYPLLYRRVKSLVTRTPISNEDSASRSFAICKNYGISTDRALRQMGFRHVDPQTLFGAEFSAAKQRVEQCPQKMGGPGNKALLYSLVRGLNAKVIVETGVAYGWSSLGILLALRENGGGRLLSSNLHYREYDGDERYVGCAVPEELRTMWTLVPKSDAEAIPEILAQANTVDLVHYDSAKSYGGRLATYPLLWNALRVGGLFVSDDIDDNLGFDHFCRMLKLTPIIVETPRPGKPSKYVGIIKKIDGRKPRNIEF